MSKKSFTCYLCEEVKENKYKGLAIGSGVLTDHICKSCSRNNYVTFGSAETLHFSPIPKEYQ
jgi:hypothetical protein